MQFKPEYIKAEIFWMSLVAPLHKVADDLNYILEKEHTEVTYRRLIDPIAGAKKRKELKESLNYIFTAKIRSKHLNPPRHFVKEELEKARRLAYSKYLNMVKEKIHTTYFIEIGQKGIEGLIDPKHSITRPGFIYALCPSLKESDEIKYENYKETYEIKRDEDVLIELRSQLDDRSRLKVKEWEVSKSRKNLRVIKPL